MSRKDLFNSSDRGYDGLKKKKKGRIPLSLSEDGGRRLRD